MLITTAAAMFGSLGSDRLIKADRIAGTDYNDIFRSGADEV